MKIEVLKEYFPEEHNAWAFANRKYKVNSDMVEKTEHSEKMWVWLVNENKDS